MIYSCSNAAALITEWLIYGHWPWRRLRPSVETVMALLRYSSLTTRTTSRFDLQRWHILASPHLIKSVRSRGPSALDCSVSWERIVHEQFLCAMDVVPSGSFFPRLLAFILLISALDIQTGCLASPGEYVLLSIVVSAYKIVLFSIDHSRTL